MYPIRNSLNRNVSSDFIHITLNKTFFQGTQTLTQSKSFKCDGQTDTRQLDGRRESDPSKSGCLRGRLKTGDSQRQRTQTSS